jgi:3,4-dihydroxy 2-butanone 4-phosphate synthase/GTP cyclohydrolase II
MNDDGTMARVPDLVKFCEEHKLLMVTVADLIRYRLQNERYVHRAGEGVLPTEYGDFRMIAYESEGGTDCEPGESHVALVYGDVTGGEIVPVRVHTHCLAGDVFGATQCDCRAIVEGSLRLIAEAGRGALVYLHSGTKGFALEPAAERVAGQPARVLLHHRGGRERGEEKSQRTLRQVGLGGQILSDLGIHRIRLLTNTPTHIPALQGFGIEIVEQAPVNIKRLVVQE